MTEIKQTGGGRTFPKRHVKEWRNTSDIATLAAFFLGSSIYDIKVPAGAANVRLTSVIPRATAKLDASGVIIPDYQFDCWIRITNREILGLSGTSSNNDVRLPLVNGMQYNIDFALPDQITIYMYNGNGAAVDSELSVLYCIEYDI